MTYWKNKVALVTGGSSGLGLVISNALAAAGSQVIMAALESSDLEDAADRVGSHGVRALALPADLTRTHDVESVFQRVQSEFGQLDVLVNCAGKSSRGRIADTTTEEFLDLLQLNFLATVRCTRAALPHLLARRGHVVNIGSLAAKVAARFLGAYPASKFPVAAYSQQLRLELGPEGLHVLLVCPGPLARADAGRRYDAQTQGLPEQARRPGGGVKLKGIDPTWLAARILKACQRRQPELIVPAKARWLFALGQLSPRLGDWLLQRKSS